VVATAIVKSIGKGFPLTPATAALISQRPPQRYLVGASVMPSSTKENALVHVVDDDLSMRDALEGLLDSVGLDAQTYRTASDFLSARLPDRPGCVVIDIRLPDMNGLDFQGKLIDIGVQLPVVMMTGHGDIAMTVKAMKRGAMDFLTKPFHDQDMLDAVMAAIERDRHRRTVELDVSPIVQRFQTLSPREQQVMLLVTAGKMNKQVAGDLGISEITAKIHRGAAMRKMGARTLADLVRMADVVKPQHS
jgi:FixJ family two-component response regulator